MFIYELPKESDIVIRSSLGLTFAEYKTKIVEVNIEKKFILVEALMHEEKIIGFKSENVINVVTAVDASDKKVYIYRKAVIDAVRGIVDKDKVFHRICTEENTIAVNRRGNYRVYLGFDGVLQAGTNRRTYDVVVKDISASGFSFLCKTEAKLKEGQQVHLMFSDKENETRFNLNGSIVHVIALDASTLLFGCAFPHEYDSLNKYVAEKQRKNKKLFKNLNERG